jgi:Domain of unknown function (DUF4412)
MSMRLPVVVLGGGLAVALTAAGPLEAQTDGTITYSASGRTLVVAVKGKQVRMSPTTGMAMILDNGTGTMTVIMGSSKMYMQQNFATATSALAPQVAGAPPAGEATSGTPSHTSITKAGTETVAGIQCTDYMVSGLSPATGQPSQAEVCVAPGVPVMDMSAITNSPMMKAMAARNGTSDQAEVSAKFKAMNVGVLKVTTIQGDTKTVVMEATKVDRSAPPDSLFQIPTGYTKMQMPAGMPGMGGAMPGAAAPQHP